MKAGRDYDMEETCGEGKKEAKEPKPEKDKHLKKYLLCKIRMDLDCWRNKQ